MLVLSTGRFLSTASDVRPRACSCWVTPCSEACRSLDMLTPLRWLASFSPAVTAFFRFRLFNLVPPAASLRWAPLGGASATMVCPMCSTRPLCTSSRHLTCVAVCSCCWCYGVLSSLMSYLEFALLSNSPRFFFFSAPRSPSDPFPCGWVGYLLLCCCDMVASSSTLARRSRVNICCGSDVSLLPRRLWRASFSRVLASSTLALRF